MKRLALIALSALVLTACAEDISPPAFDEETVDLEAPAAPVVRAGDGVVQLDWDGLSGADAYRVYRDEGVGSEEIWVAEEALTVWLDDEVSNLHLYRYRVVGLDGGLEGPSSERTSALPALYSVVIAGDQASSASSTVGLDLGAPSGTAWMRLAENDGLAEATWQPYRSELSWELEGEDGLRSIEAEFRDALDNVSLPVSDSIVLDTRAQILGFDFTPDGILNAEDVVDLALVTGELGGEAWAEIESLTLVPLYDNGVAPDTVAADGVFAGRWIVGSGQEVENARVWGNYTDPLGNEAIPYLATGSISVSGN